MRKYLPIVILLLIAALIYGGYNSMVNNETKVEEMWANVESQYQRRADLVPNLARIIERYTDYERSTLQEIVETRASATQPKVDPANITADQLAAFQAAQSQVGSALNRLLAIVENYPDLKANQQFEEFMAQYEGTENRVNDARDRFNAAVQRFNAHIRRFPQNLYAGTFGFEKKEWFKAEEGTDKAPVIFDDKAEN